jgi:uncharacterized membrane protein
LLVHFINKNKWTNIHVWAGRIISILAMVVGLTALFMAIVFPFTGLIESISLVFLHSSF